MSKRLVLSACAVVLLSAGALAMPGVATTTVDLWAEPDTASEVLGEIPAGARLHIIDCRDGWCAVKFRGERGFAIATALDASRRPRTLRRTLSRGADPDDFKPTDREYPSVVYGPGPHYPPGPFVYFSRRYLGPTWGYEWRRE